LGLFVFTHFTEGFDDISEKGIFVGWTWYTLLPVMVNALGGLIVGQVTKHVGAVYKGFALITGVLLTGFAQLLIYGTHLDLNTWVAIPLVVCGIYIHAAYPYGGRGGRAI